jgi:hypothetical protein
MAKFATKEGDMGDIVKRVAELEKTVLRLEMIVYISVACVGVYVFILALLFLVRTIQMVN